MLKSKNSCLYQRKKVQNLKREEKKRKKRKKRKMSREKIGARSHCHFSQPKVHSSYFLHSLFISVLLNFFLSFFLSIFLSFCLLLCIFTSFWVNLLEILFLCCFQTFLFALDFCFFFCLPPGFLLVVGPTEPWWSLLHLAQPLPSSYWAGTDLWLYPKLITLCIVHRDGVTIQIIIFIAWRGQVSMNEYS